MTQQWLPMQPAVPKPHFVTIEHAWRQTEARALWALLDPKDELLLFCAVRVRDGALVEDAAQEARRDDEERLVG